MAAMEDTYKNLATGARQLAGDFIPGVPPADREAWKYEEARQNARAQSDPRYAQARTFHGIVNPTAAIGGTTTKILPSAAAAFAQNVLEPKGSLAEQLESGVVGGVTQGGSTLVSKAIPATGQAPYMKGALNEAERRAKQLGVNVTNTQLNPRDELSRFVAAAVDPVSHLKQIEQMTTGLLRETGSKATRMSTEALDAQSTVLNKQFDDLLSNAKKATFDATKKAELQKLIKDNPAIEEIMASQKAPTLSKMVIDLNQVGQKHPGGGILTSARMGLDDLHRAYREIGRAAPGEASHAAGELRNWIKGAIEDTLEKTGQRRGSFDQLNKKWGSLEDVTKIWDGGAGQGQGRAAGMIRPTAIMQYVKEMPEGSPIKSTAGMIHSLGIRDFGEEVLRGLDVTKPMSMIGSAASILPDPLLRYLNKSISNSDPGAKLLAEMLRAGAARGPNELLEETRE